MNLMLKNNQPDEAVLKPENGTSPEALNVSPKIVQECIFEQILTDSKFKDGFHASELCEPLVAANRVLDKLERDKWLVRDDAENIWRLNPAHRLSPYGANHGNVTPDTVYCATPVSLLRRESLESYRANLNEGDDHLWVKFALEFTRPHFSYSTHEPYDTWRTPDYLFQYERTKQDLQGEALLVFCTYSSSNSVIEQVLDYLRRGYGVRIVVPEGGMSVRSAVRDELSEITEINLTYGSFNASKGWLTLGELITPNKIEYKIRDAPEGASSPDGLTAGFSEEMCPSKLEGNSWELNWDVHPSGYAHVGTFHLPEVSGLCSRCNDYDEDDHTHSVEIYANREETHYIIEQAQVHGPAPRFLSRTELREWVQQGNTTRIGPATGNGLYQ